MCASVRVRACRCVCLCVYQQAMKQEGSIRHMWRKWGNLEPGVKEVMDFNTAIVVNGSLN